MLEILDPSGNLVGSDPGLSENQLLDLYTLMVRARTFDRRSVTLQRQGRIGTYPPLEGQEAAQIGSAYALESQDWVYPGYREHGVQIARGMPMEVVLGYWKGIPNPDWNPSTFKIGLIAVPIATHLPHAVGHAYQARLAGDDLVTVSYIGDGGTSEGDFHAALNFAGVWKAPTVFVCQNNHYAISVPLHRQTAAETIADKALGYGIPAIRVDGMDVLAVYSATRDALRRARAGDGPTFIEAVTYRYGPHATADDPTLYRHEAEVEKWREKDPIIRLGIYLESKGLELAEVDAKATAELGAAIEALEAKPIPPRADAIRHTFERIPPTLVSQIQRFEKAAGEASTKFPDDEIWTVGQDSDPPGPTAAMTMANALNAALHEAMEVHPETVVLGEDVAVAGGVFRITGGLLAKFGDERVIDTPLAESGIVGTAIGMALAGGRPIAEIQFDGFVYPAFDQIVSHLGRIRYRGRGTVSVPVVVRMPNGAGIGAHEHHCDSPEAYFAHAPGLVVVVPSTPFDAKGLLASAIESNDPVIFLEPKVLYRAGREEVPVDRYTLPLGRAKVRRPGSDLTLVTYGGMVRPSLAAANSLSEGGISVEVVDLRTIFPWDEQTVLESVHRTGRLVLVQEPPRTAGVAAEVAATVAERAAYSLQAPIVRVCGLDAPIPHFAIEHHGLIDEDDIVMGVRRVMES